MVKKYFRNSIAGACMAMSLALGATSIGSVAVMAEEDPEVQDAEAVEAEASEEEVLSAPEETAAEAVPEETMQEETVPAVDMSAVTVTQDIMSPSIGDTVRDTFDISFNIPGDTEFTYDIDSAMVLTELDVSSSSIVFGGKLTVSYAGGSADIDINQEKIDLSNYSGIYKIAIRPAQSDAESGSANFSALFTIAETKDAISNNATVTSSYGSASAQMNFSVAAVETEAEEGSIVFLDETNPEETGGFSDDTGGTTEGTGETGETGDTDPETDQTDDTEQTESNSESESTEESESESESETEPIASNSYVTIEQSSETPAIGESFSQTVRVAYDKPEDTSIIYEVPSSVKLESIEVDAYCNLFGGTIVLEHEDGSTILDIDEESISLSPYTGIKSLTIKPNEDTYGAESGSGQFIINMKTTEETETVATTATVQTTYDSPSFTYEYSPSYCVLTTPEITVSEKSIDYGKNGIVYFKNIGAEFNGSTSNMEFVINVPSELELKEVVLPEFSGVSTIDLYATKDGAEKLIGEKSPGASFSLGGTGYTSIRLVIYPSEMSVRSTSEGQLILQATENMSSDLSASFSGTVTSTFGENEYSKKSDAEACTFNVVKTYTVSFDAQGGSSVSSVSAKENETITINQTTSRSGYNFLGWYTKASGGEKKTSLTVTEDTTLYAHWEEQETEPPQTEPPQTETQQTETTQPATSQPESSSPSGTETEQSESEEPDTEESETEETGKTTEDTKQQILERALEDAEEAEEAEERADALTDRINSIINSATSGSDDDSSSSSSASDPATYEDWTVKPIFEDIIENLVKMYIQPIDESIVSELVPDEELLEENLAAEAEAEEESETDEETIITAIDLSDLNASSDET